MAVMSIYFSLLLIYPSLNLDDGEIWGKISMFPSHEDNMEQKHKIDFIPSILPPKCPSLLEIEDQREDI